MVGLEISVARPGLLTGSTYFSFTEFFFILLLRWQPWTDNVHSKMSSQEATWERLDSEFDHYLVDMKPYVLKLAHKSERQRCALWVKKLCDPSGAGTGVMGRKNRNMYAKLLLHMLRRGVLEGPFTHRPEQGSLKTLPTYMSIYFDEPSMAKELDYSAESLPDWVTGELGSGDSRSKDSWRTSSKVDHASLSFLQATNRLAFSQKRAVTSSDESDFEARLNSWNLGVCSLYELWVQVKLAIEMKSKMVEAKFHEEKLKLQQKHDTDVQKILERKNNEIEELKALCRSKQKEAEEMNKNLERRVQSLVRESQRIRESKEQQIAELKKMAEQSADCLKNDWEKKLHNIVADLEQEKFELQKKHTGNIQELLEDTNSRLGKMEAEYSAQTKATNQMVKELETRVQQLTVEAESNMLVRQKLMQDKGELEQRCHRLSSELQDVKSRYGALQKDKQHVLQEHEQTRRQLQSKRDSEVNYLKQEQARSAAKVHHNQVTRLLSPFHPPTHSPTRPMLFLYIPFCLFSEKEDELARVSEMQKLQALQADTALEEFKRQVELNSDKVYSEMKQQMEKVEVDLSRSKCVREKQSKEFSRQLEEHKQRSEQQIVELKLEREQEKTYLFQQHSAEKDSLVREHEREIDNLEKQLRAAIVEHENQTRQLRKQDTQVKMLEAQVHQLREELIQVNSQRKQQLVELGLLREEEKQKALREHEAGVSKLRAEMERMKLEMQRASTTELEQAAEKTSSRLKQIDKEYSQRLLKSSQTIAELQAAISTLREENSRQQLAAERQHQEAVGRFEDEKRLLIRDNDRVIKNLENEIENGGNQRHALEKKLQHRELEVQEQIVHIQQEYQLKMKGLMPAIVRQELEDTIASLKSQVNFLQKRASILQEEVTSYRNRR
uniref:Centrosomal protein 112 n=2 Tax=Callorhinchus milii TaxID=7868 RepID=A0A4W3KKQ1_CALMI